MKSKFLIVVVAAVTAVIAFVVVKSLTPRPSLAGGPQASETKEAAPAIIEGLKLEPAMAGESRQTVEATGKVGPNANRVVRIGTRIPGRIVSVKVSTGDRVATGQTLAIVSSIELAHARSAYRQASSRLRSAEEAHENRKRLAKLGAFAGRPVEEAHSEHASAQGDLAQAKSELAQNQSELARAEIEVAQCAARLERARELYKDQIISKQDLEGTEAEYKSDLAAVDSAKSKIRQTEAKIQQLESRARIAANYLAREEKVLSGDLLSNKELQAARAEVQAAKVELQAAADAIRVLGASPSGSGDTVAIKSPISGHVIERNVSIGEMVDPSDALFVLMDLSEVWVEADVYEKDLAKIRNGQPAEVRTQSYPDKAYTGTVTYVGDVLDSGSRTAKVRCVVSNRDGALKPEMFASVSIITARSGKTVLVAKQSVLDEDGKKIVFVPCTDCPEDEEAGKSACGTFDKREVKVGSARGEKIEVIKGIEPGEQIVTDGSYQIKSALDSGQLVAGCCP